MADARYIDGLWRRYLAARDSVPDDWRNAFDFVLHFYGPPAEEQTDGSEYLRRFGHRHADLDPLGLATPAALPADLERHPIARAFTGSLAIETGHIDDPAMVGWIERRFAALQAAPRTPSLQTYGELLRSDVFERVMAAKFTAKKRFGSEGADAIVPLVRAICRRAQANGITEIVVGSMHRGRLTLMTNAFGMPTAELFARMRGRHPFGEQSELPADVPYHFGCDAVVDGVHIRLLPNPSHLEAVNPVAVGAARARGARPGGTTLALLLHTDASAVAQGVNAELIQMSALPGYSVGGTVHVVINNQIGFTTDPAEARSGRYCTAGWRAVDSLIVHANGNDVDAVVDAGGMAVDFCQTFARDAVIDLICYRANGHNEIDEPRFTQPGYYRAVDALPGVAARYEQRLVEHALIDAAGIAAARAALKAEFDAAYSASDAVTLTLPAVPTRRAPLPALDEARLRALGETLSTMPDGARANAKMARIVGARTGELDDGVGWPFAEALALASLLDDGVSLRFSGQDIERGSFSQRHLAAIDPESSARTSMLDRFARAGASVEIINSPLSEYAVLGFEYGHSLAALDALTLWEAQFGDFANGAQIIVDQFLASAAEKWQLQSGLVVLLPHGLEGQGPEHSSARPERLLQLCARDNLRVAHPSTPANYFHLLRAQAASDRPLIVLTPKVLLRLPEARSALEVFVGDAAFEPVIVSDPGAASDIVLCSGKIAYELEKARAATSAAVAILRLEQLYPFPDAALDRALAAGRYRTMTWLQEEPANFGAWQWLAPRLAALAARHGIAVPRLVARAESASPAGSFHDYHLRDQQRLLDAALGLGTGHG